MVTLAISSLPTILWKEITGEIPIWHTWVRLGLLAIFLAASFLY
jgi:hypothetical protein